ncbi:hypothetical protein O6H91_11G087400 [Diphasiastrum complanatum]|uniref:Uncharacterized protein n=1 Tax=Diphasiastrum complanatum TaxID=34168 RepID=A0ACC2CBT0_DIPCM|nr:hypothetical protein O6H91_11G087400 [Diphasiastrum complanatum]
MGKEVSKLELEDGTVDRIGERLSFISDIYLPHALAERIQPLSPHEKKSHLVALLRRDAAIFLERYGQILNSSELQEFEVLQDDYEVSWHLKQLKTTFYPTVQEQKSRTATVKNRRLAYMDRLVQDGQYFSEDSMRMRSPLLHHEYVGQFQDPSIRGAARLGERFSEMLIRQFEEAFIQQRLNEERMEAGIPMETEQETIEEFEEEEEEESDDEEGSGSEEDEGTSDEEHGMKMHSGQQSFGEFSNKESPYIKLNEVAHDDSLQPHADGFDRGISGSRPSRVEIHNKVQDFTRNMQQKFLSEGDSDEGKPQLAGSVLSEVEIQDKLEDFTRIMQEKFLSGGDSEHVDYSRIDGDSTLDDYWLGEISRDAEEKYFEED